jgi:acyl carrier protein
MYRIGGFIMTIGSLTPLPTPLSECFSIHDVRILVAKQLGVDLEFVTSEAHFTNDLGADLLHRVELMLAIEAKFAGVEITDDDIEQIQVVGDLIQHLNEKQVKP